MMIAYFYRFMRTPFHNIYVKFYTRERKSYPDILTFADIYSMPLRIQAINLALRSIQSKSQR